MIVGIGTDIVEVERIRSLLEKNGETFLNKILRPNEIKTCCGSANKVQRIAARFAAKEALDKAFGTGIFGEINCENIEISNGENGEPHITLFDKAALIQQERGVDAIHVSLSHTEQYATAFVVLESR